MPDETLLDTALRRVREAAERPADTPARPATPLPSIPVPIATSAPVGRVAIDPSGMMPVSPPYGPLTAFDLVALERTIDESMEFADAAGVLIEDPEMDHHHDLVMEAMRAWSKRLGQLNRR